MAFNIRRFSDGSAPRRPKFDPPKCLSLGVGSPPKSPGRFSETTDSNNPCVHVSSVPLYNVMGYDTMGNMAPYLPRRAQHYISNTPPATDSAPANCPY